MELEKVLNHLEEAIKRLQLEYEQYLTGVLKKEPLDLRREVERIIASYNRRRINNTALRFRFNALAARFNTYKNYWERVLRKREEGKVLRTDANERDLKVLYLEYIEARRRCNQPTDHITYEDLIRKIKAHLGSGKGVNLSVRIKDGKAILVKTRKKGA